MTSDELILWGTGTTRTMRAQWMLQELGLAFTHQPIQSRSGETQTEAYLRLNPKGKIPALQHGDLVLSESAAIAFYLAEAFALPSDFLQARDAATRSKLNEWCFFIISELDAHSLYLIRRHGDLPQIYGEAPVAVASAEEYFLKQINAVADRVDAAGRYLMGDAFSVADILMTTIVEWGKAYSIALPSPLYAYHHRIAERPAYVRAYEINYPDRDLREVLVARHSGPAWA